MTWRDWPTYSVECRRDVQTLLTSGKSLTAYRANARYGAGPKEGSWAWKAERLAERVHNVPHVVLCASGTVALDTLLQVLLRFGPGRQVVTTALTFSATVAAILVVGLEPVFADVSIPSCTLDAESVSRVTGPEVAAYLGVDLFGRQADWAITDACQSVGVAPIADYGVWSFNGRKNVPAGEGGAIFARDVEVAQRARLLLNHAENFNQSYVGRNGHVNEVTACLIYHGLKAVKQRNRHRQHMAARLNTILALSPRLTTPDPMDHALYVYPLILDREMPVVAARLKRKGIECQPGYIQPPLHYYPAFQGFKRDSLANTMALSESRLLVFPQITPTVTCEEVDRLGDAILQAVR